MRIKNIKSELGIIGLFSFLSIAHTFPLILCMSTSIFGDPKWLFDSLGGIYGTWWTKYTFIHDLPRHFNHLIAYPFGAGCSYLIQQPALDYPLLLLSLVRNEIFAHNVFVLSSFILSALVVYYLVVYLTGNKLAAVVSGIIYSFCPNHTLHAFSHLGLAAIQWMPFYLLLLIKFSERWSLKYGILTGLVFCLVFLTSIYYGYYMLLFTFGFCLFLLMYRLVCKGGSSVLNLREWLRRAGVVVLACAVVLILVLPFIWDMVELTFLSGNKQAAASVGTQRPYGDLFRYAARVTDYFVPSEYHPLWGKVDFWFIKPYKAASRHWSERTLYLGFVPLLLALYGIFATILSARSVFPPPRGGRLGGGDNRRSHTSQNTTYYVLLFIFWGILAFLFSLSPVIKLGPVSVPMPSGFMYKILPMFRVYARFGLLVNLSVAVLAGFGLTALLQRVASLRIRFLLCSAVVVLILFEFTVIPPFRNVDFREHPEVYQWLAKQDDDVVVAEYPILRSSDERHYTYLFYQRIHGKRLINGATEGSFADDIRKKIRLLCYQQTPMLLRALGTDYIIVHKSKYKPSALAQIENYPGYSQVKEFPAAVVFGLEKTA